MYQMSTEQSTECPDCHRMSVYDYNGMPVCEDCYREAIEQQPLTEDDWRTETPKD